MKIGYCTNVHAGVSLDEVVENLQRFALPVKQQTCPNSPMGIGLWLSSQAVSRALVDERWQKLKDWLDENQLVPYTFNAFPYADFHQDVVKRDVYLPDWSTANRAEYTMNVMRLMAHLLPDGSRGTLSTLPIGWPSEQGPSSEIFQKSQANMMRCIDLARQIHDQTGVRLQLCIEPEPGCILQTSAQTVNFFKWYLLSSESGGEANRPHVGVCHDICHAAVMFEDQVAALERYDKAGVPIGKVQISSALQTEFQISKTDTCDRLEALKEFDEPRYMHQTCLKMERPPLQYFDELEMAIQVQANENFAGQMRSHFHVPIHLASTGILETTQPEIKACLDWMLAHNHESQFEVETYAWQVSPESVRNGTLIDSIAAELIWLNDQFPQLEKLNRV